MSHPSNGRLYTYQVHCSAQIAQVVGQLREEADEANLESQFFFALKTISRRLEAYPQYFGEPLYRLPGMNLLMYIAVYRPLVVSYAVDEERRLVYLQNARLLLPPS